MKFLGCDNICDKAGMVLTLVTISSEDKIIHLDCGGHIHREVIIKTYKKIQCERCLFLIKKEKEK